MIGNYILCFIISYLLGTIPGAYIVGRLFAKIDIREEGTGNVGAMNTLEVTGRKSFGLLVLLIDLLKGLAAVALTCRLLGSSFELCYISFIAALLGHNYNIFLRFKGGRGLATTVGCSLFLNPSQVIAWALLFLASYFLIKKNVHIGNIVATILTTFVLIIIPESILTSLNVAVELTKQQIVLITAGVCFVIMLRHIQPLREILKKSK